MINSHKYIFVSFLFILIFVGQAAFADDLYAKSKGFENDKLVEVNYQITSTKNAMSAGPISVSAGIAITVPSGCSWTIV